MGTTLKNKVPLKDRYGGGCIQSSNWSLACVQIKELVANTSNSLQPIILLLLRVFRELWHVRCIWSISTATLLLNTFFVTVHVPSQQYIIAANSKHTCRHYQWFYHIREDTFANATCVHFTFKQLKILCMKWTVHLAFHTFWNWASTFRIFMYIVWVWLTPSLLLLVIVKFPL